VGRRKGDVAQASIRFLHTVGLPAGAVRGQENSAVTWGLAKKLGVAPYPLTAFYNDRHFAMFHFKTAEAALAFHEWFGGELRSVEPQRGRRQRPAG
jgi:hypothetical protein